MPKVLVVDDAQFMRMRCARLLSENGFEVLEAQNGAEAVRVYQAHRPDVVLMDITMPEMDGLTALRQIRCHDPEARVVMLTALGQQGIVIEAIKSGARDFIVKPFDTERVLSAVRKMLT
ncbi:MAG: response regulator [Anaerolineae bacterium]|nr:response regulator [Anaerolineae bacterium]MDW8099705.1 response regulator [Anaerolineae bacterium]